MNSDGKSCPQNFQVWVAFLMGMVVIVIAIVVFDRVSKSRIGSADIRVNSADMQGPVVGLENYTQPVSLISAIKDGAWLGIEVNDISQAMAKQLGLGISGGVLVSRVFDKSPADKAGLLSGDIIFEFDRRDVDDTDQLGKLLSKADPGDRVRLSLLREGNREVVYVVLEEAVNANSTSSVRQIAGDIIPDDQKWGIVVSGLTDSLRTAYSISADEKGVVVMMVVPGSAAARAGLNKGDLIRQVNQMRVDDITDFFEAIQTTEEGSSVLNIYRQGAALFINMVAVLPSQAQVLSVAQEGIGMNRPLYVPGYDQTQSGDPDAKTKSLQTTSVPLL